MTKSLLKRDLEQSPGTHDLNKFLELVQDRGKIVRYQVTENYINKSKMMIIYLNLFNEDFQKKSKRYLESS